MEIDKKLVYVSLFSIFWSFLIIFNKFVLNLGINPAIYGMYRLVIGFIILTFYVSIIRKQKLHLPNRTNIRNLLSMGVFLSLGFLAAIFGLEMSTSINYGFIIKSSVIFTPTLAFFFLDENFSKTKIFLIPTFIFGIYLISTNGKLIVPHKGDMLILLGAFCFSIANIISKKLTKKMNSNNIAIYRNLITACFFFVFSLIFLRNLIPNVPFLYLIIAGIISGIADLFLMKTIDISSVSYLSMMSVITPIIVSVISFLFLKESFTIIQAIGGIIIIISSVLVQKKNI